MRKIFCKKYDEFDYLYLDNNEKLCLIDKLSLQDDEILIRDIIEMDRLSETLKFYDMETDFNDYNQYKLNQKDLETFKEYIENNYLYNNVYYIKLSADDDIHEFLRYIRNDKIVNYIRDVY